MPAGGFNPGGRTTGHLLGTHAAIEPSASPGERADDAVQILEWMELRLTRKVQARTALEALHRRLQQLLDFDAGLPRRLELLVQIRLIVFGREEQIAADALKLCVDVLLRADALDPGNRGSMAVARQPRAFDAVQANDLLVTVIDDIRQVRRCHAGLSAARRAVIDQDDRLLVAGQQVGSRDPRDTRADDTHIGSRVLTERGLAVRMSGLEPERCRFHRKNPSKRRTDTWHSRC